MRKPLPYCSPQMLALLRDIAAVGCGPNEEAVGTLAALRSRGWLNRDNKITPAGHAYLATRADK